MDAKVVIPAAPSENRSQRTRDKNYASRKQAGGGGGGGGDWQGPSDHYGPQVEATEVGPRVPDQRERERVPKPACGTCGGEECVLMADKERGLAGICKWGPDYGAHSDLPKVGQFAGSDTQKTLGGRGHQSLLYGTRANGDKWEDLPLRPGIAL